MSQKRYMLALVGLLMTGGAMGMESGLEDVRAKHQKKFLEQRAAEAAAEKEKTIANTEKQIAEIKKNLNKLAIEIEQKAGGQRDTQPGIAKSHRDLAAAQQELVAAGNILQEAQGAIAAADAVIAAGSSLSEDDRIAISNYRDNLNTFRARLIRAESAVGAAEASIVDYGKEDSRFSDLIKPLLDEQKGLIEKLRNAQRELSDLTAKKISNLPDSAFIETLGRGREEKIREQQAQAQRQQQAQAQQQLQQQNQLPSSSSSSSAGSPSQNRPPLKNKTSRQSLILSGLGAAAGVAIAAGMLYVGLKWYQKKQISAVVARHGKMQDDFTFQQRDMMAAAVLASSKIPGSLQYLRRQVNKYDVGSELIPEELMWHILADIYYRKSVHLDRVQEFKKLVVPAAE